MTREQLILNKRPLVAQAVKAYLRRNPTLNYLRDDLESAATVGLIKGIDRLTPRITDVDAYLMRTMLREMASAVVREDTVYIPERSRHRAKAAGAPIEPIYCGKLPQDLIHRGAADPLQDLLEFCRDERERKIIQLCAAGYRHKEIGEQLGVGGSRVNQIIREIESRLDADDARTDAPYNKPRRECGSSKWCACGQPVRFSNEIRCEDCWAVDQQRYHGISQRANLKAA
jgi:RNA polymerase sigma factor (sigma-70 family)